MKVLRILAVCIGPWAAFPAAAADDAVAFIDENLNRAPTNTVIPKYPEAARRDRIEGEVTVCYRIDREGRPHNVRVRYSSHRAFERPARRAVRESRYAPLAAGSEPSPVKSCRTFRFYLEPVEPDG